MSLAKELQKVLHGSVEDAPKVLEAYSRDASLFKVVPEVVVHPKNTDDICALVQFVNVQKEIPKTHLSLTARAAGTDMSGGPLTDSIVLDMTAHFTRLLTLGHDCAVVEPGMYFRDFDRETQKKGLELPSYTASRELNTVGGMVANNSGGEKNLKYGKTARYVEELEVVLADGHPHVFKKLGKEELAVKCAEPGFEGDIYRKMSALVRTHAATIAAATPKVEKNSSGYALWDIGDGVEALDLARLFVGSQGTLGIITKIKFSLVRPLPYSAMVVLFLDNLSELGALVPEVLKAKPDSFESYDDHTFKLGVKYFPEFARQMVSKGAKEMSLFKLFWSFLPEVWMVMRGGVPKLVLMAEFRGGTQLEALTKAVDLAGHITKTQPRVSVRVARSEKAARKYWVIRRESFNLLRQKVRGMRTAPFIDDFVVPPNTLPQFLPKLEHILEQYELTYTVAGHVGDGNFHIIPLIDPKDQKMRRVIDELSHKVYDLVLAYGGSISGEHNDGLVRTPYVPKMFGPAMYALFLEVKKIFDPQNIFNPGKKVGTTYSDALTKLDLPPIKTKKVSTPTKKGRMQKK